MREKMSFQINITETHRSFALQHIGSNPAFMCGWAHGEEEVGKDSPRCMLAGNPSKKMVLCSFWAKGCCLRIGSCLFAHGEEELGMDLGKEGVQRVECEKNRRPAAEEKNSR